jgi:hypothetical protein
MSKYYWFFFGSVAGTLQATIVYLVAKDLWWISAFAMSVIAYNLTLFGTAALEFLIEQRKVKNDNV